ncbi:cytochrome C [Neisseria sp. P0008.S010]|uniref:cytochrome C n=1 Tax=Neisseria sp. P0008.S010 TaxID=3436707 RepID=UPI003F7FF2DD
MKKQIVLAVALLLTTAAANAGGARLSCGQQKWNGTELGVTKCRYSGKSLSDAYTAALKKEGQNGVLPKTLPTRNIKRQINEETEISIQWTGTKIVNVCVNNEGFDCFELKQQKDYVDVTFTVATP